MSERKIDSGLFGPQDALEVLIGDVMKTEPFPREIQVLGYASGWRHKLELAAGRRGLVLRIEIEDAVP